MDRSRCGALFEGTMTTNRIKILNEWWVGWFGWLVQRYSASMRGIMGEVGGIRQMNKK